MTSPDAVPPCDRDLNDLAVEMHRRYRGKIQMIPKVPVRDQGDFGIWYTPGVAAACRCIQQDVDAVYEQTNRGNTVAVVSDGSRILGLGNIGPEAGLPVMEGKALLFKYLGGVDAVPLCVRTNSAEELIGLVQQLEPTFGGINLEDISQPKCFQVLDALRSKLQIPVWHDDQQGTATVVLAALWNALDVTGRTMRETRIAMIGTGAANVATFRLLLAAGADPGQIVACDSHGVLHRLRSDIEALSSRYQDKWRICCETNSRQIRGGIEDCLADADVCIAFSKSGPNVIRPEWIRRMSSHAIVFACANPVPEIWPFDARLAGARVVATGRGDFPNQVNNSLIFPAIFRGAFDVRATAITDGMALAAARELADAAKEKGLNEFRIVPSMCDWEIYPRIATAVALQSQKEGKARLVRSADKLLKDATDVIRRTREIATQISAQTPPCPA